MTRLLVKLVSVSFRGDAEELFRSLGFSVVHRFEGFPLYVVEGDAELDAAAYDFIQSVDVDRPIPSQFVPNDTYYGSQSYLQKLNLEEAWDRATGTGVVIADCDTGVPSGLAELDGQLVPGWNIIAGTSNVAPDSAVFHGTFVTGVMVAKTNNSLGVTGVAFNAKVLPIRVDVPGSSGGALASNLIAGIEYAANHPDVSIINVSYLLTTTPDTFDDVITYAASRGKLVVTSAGNTSTVISTPFAEALVVSGINNDYSYWANSNYGAAVDITAVASSIYSINNSGAAHVWEGTSFSSPQIAAIAALVKGVYPQYNAYDLKAILVGSANRNPSGSSWGSGRNDRVGAGIADAKAALDLANAKTWLRLKYKNPVATIQTTLNDECAVAGASTPFTLVTKAIHAPIVSRAFVVDGVDQGTTFTGDSTEVSLTLGSGNHVLELTVTDAVGGVTTARNTVKCLQGGTTAATELSIPTRVPQGKTLQARVRAKNVSGDGPWTSWTSVNSGTSAILPDAPRLSEVYNNGTNAELYHEAMSRSTGYQYRVDGGTPVDGGGYPIVIPRDVGKSVQIRATYLSGDGVWSQSYTIDPAPVISDLSLVTYIQSSQDTASEDAQSTVSVSSGAVQSLQSLASHTSILLTESSPAGVASISEVSGVASTGQHTTEASPLAGQTGAAQLAPGPASQSSQSASANASQSHTPMCETAGSTSQSGQSASAILQVSQVFGTPCDSHNWSGEIVGTVELPLGASPTGLWSHTADGAVSAKVIVQGSFATTESGSDTAVASAKVIVSGTLAASESGQDSAAIAGKIAVTGSLTANESGSTPLIAAVSLPGALISDPLFVLSHTAREFTLNHVARTVRV